MHDTLTCGAIEDLASIPPNIVGSVLDANDKHISQITAMIVVVNESRADWPNRYKALENAGHDPMQVVEYYGKKTTVLEIIARCNKRSKEFAAFVGN